MTPIPTLHTPEEVSLILKLNPQTVLRFIREKKIKAIKIGRKYYIKESSLDEYLNQ